MELTPINEQIIQYRRLAVEHFQKAAWNQMLALENFRENNLLAAERFAQLSFEDQMLATEYAELADAEAELYSELD